MDKFWPSILPGYKIDESFENISIDVALKNCFDNYDTTACVGNLLLTVIGLITLFLCIIRIIRLHYLHHQQIHQYLVFYFASFEMIFLTLKWVALTRFYQLEFAASLLKLIQFILLCHFNWSLVSRILHRTRLLNWFIMPLLFVLFGFLTAVTTLGLIAHLSTWVECLAPHWLLLSVAEFLGLQIYIVAGIYITRNINAMSSLDSFKAKQKRELWSVIIVYSISSLTSLIYYSTLQALGNFEIGCSGIFDHVQEIYSTVYAVFMVIKYLLPIWIMIIVFYPTRGTLSSEEERLLGWFISGSTTSIFTPNTSSYNVYRQLIVPVDNGFSDEHSNLRRSASSPALFIKPALTPISEEGPVFSAARGHYESYGATDSFSPPFQPLVRSSARVRTRHNSGHPSKNDGLKRGRQIPVSLNQCPDDVESITPSSGERA